MESVKDLNSPSAICNSGGWVNRHDFPDYLDSLPVVMNAPVAKFFARGCISHRCVPRLTFPKVSEVGFYLGEMFLSYMTRRERRRRRRRAVVNLLSPPMTTQFMVPDTVLAKFIAFRLPRPDVLRVRKI